MSGPKTTKDKNTAVCKNCRPKTVALYSKQMALTPGFENAFARLSATSKLSKQDACTRFHLTELEMMGLAMPLVGPPWTIEPTMKHRTGRQSHLRHPFTDPSSNLSSCVHPSSGTDVYGMLLSSCVELNRSGSCWAVIIVSEKDAQIDPRKPGYKPADIYRKQKLLTRYLPKRNIRKTKLLGGSESNIT